MRTGSLAESLLKHEDEVRVAKEFMHPANADAMHALQMAHHRAPVNFDNLDHGLVVLVTKKNQRAGLGHTHKIYRILVFRPF